MLTNDPSRRDPDGDKRRALKHAARSASKLETSERDRDAAILFASEVGSSLREIADATGLSHMSVKRILERTPANS